MFFMIVSKKSLILYKLGSNIRILSILNKITFPMWWKTNKSNINNNAKFQLIFPSSDSPSISLLVVISSSRSPNHRVGRPSQLACMPLCFLPFLYHSNFSVPLKLWITYHRINTSFSLSFFFCLFLCNTILIFVIL